MVQQFVANHPGVWGAAFLLIVGGSSAWALLVGHRRYLAQRSKAQRIETMRHAR